MPLGGLLGRHGTFQNCTEIKNETLKIIYIYIYVPTEICVSSAGSRRKDKDKGMDRQTDELGNVHVSRDDPVNSFAGS